MFRIIVPILCLALSVVSDARGADTLDRARVLCLARERAASITAARAREEAASATLAAARGWPDDPVLDLVFGRRSGDGWDREATLAQPLDLPGRGPRIAAATASARAATATVGAATADALALAGRLYLDALRATADRDLATEAVALHEHLLAMAREREDAGDAGALETQLAAVSLERQRAALALAGSRLVTATGTLADLLALDALPRVAGPLTWPVTGSLTELETAASQRADVTLLAARREAALARAGLARAGRWPRIDVMAGYAREEATDIARVGLALSLPVTGRAAATARAAEAEAAALAAELAAARHAAAARVRAAWQRRANLQAALAADTEITAAHCAELARASYELGESGLEQVLLIQREVLDARAVLTDLRYAAAVAALDLATAAGVDPLPAPPAVEELKP